MANDLLNRPTEYDNDEAESSDDYSPADSFDPDGVVDGVEDTKTAAELGDDGLEDSYAADSATDEDLPEGHPSRGAYSPRSPSLGRRAYKAHRRHKRRKKRKEKRAAKKELKAAEEAGNDGVRGEDSAVDDQVSPEEESFYNEDKDRVPKKLSILSSRRRKALVGGGAGGVLFSGYIIFTTVITGPGQLVHLSSILNEANFSDQEGITNSRVFKMAKFAFYVRKPQYMRIGPLQGAYSAVLERNLSRNGITSEYKPRTGLGDGFSVDPKSIGDNSPLSQVKNASPEDVAEFMKKNFKINGADVEIRDGKVFLKSKSFGYFAQRRLVRQMLVAGGNKGRVANYLRSRIMTKKTGSTLNPIHKLDYKILDAVDAKYAKWKEEFAERIRNGSEPPKANISPTQGEEGQDGTRAPPSDVDTTAAAAANEVTGGADDAGRAATKASARAKLTAKAGGISAIAGIACAVKAIANSIDEFQYTNVILPQIHLAVEFMAVGAQIQSGEVPDFTQVGFYANQLFEHKVNDEVSSWVDAETFRHMMGQDPTGSVPMRSELVPVDEGNIVTQFFETVPGIGPVCDAVTSPVGTVISVAIDIASGPFSAAAGFAFSTFLAPELIEGLVNTLAGDVVNLDLQGANMGNALANGGRLAANESCAVSGCVPLTSAEEGQLNYQRKLDEREEFASKDLSYRLFAAYDHRSLFGQAIYNSKPVDSRALSNVASSLVNIPSLIGNLATAFAPTKASAAIEDYDWGYPKLGYTAEEADNPAVDNPFENAIQVETILKTDRGDDLRERAKKCLGIEMDENGLIDNFKTTSPKYKDLMDPALNCADKSEDWLRVRFAILDTQLLEAIACSEGADDSCANIGMGTEQSTAGVEPVEEEGAATDQEDGCAPNTEKMAGLYEGYVNGQQTQLTLCAVNDIPIQAIDGDGSESTPGTPYYVNGANNRVLVSSTVSAKVAEMAAKAKADGTPLVAISSFRTNAHQSAACGVITNGVCSNSGYALPGRSAHQSGEAIDFLDSNRNSTANCAKSMQGNRCVGTDAVWKWLDTNAAAYGFKQLPRESWHWSTSGT